ncbi:hypothetical protein HWX41_08520 [Bacillus paramycoides]|uniref:hypothetical protein n=1 Tax=Bacillus paramycoides TaxID=2026194 RepID=UPI0015BF0980|nr:hypothetical protein [Bacillus paramycoides]NWK69131.1 hypothetical protein [Bacillus paramycoides]
MNSLQPGQTCKISNAYVGMTDKVPIHVIIRQLTKKDYKIKQSRLSLTLYEFSLMAMSYPHQAKKVFVPIKELFLFVIVRYKTYTVSYSNDQK